MSGLPGRQPGQEGGPCHQLGRLPGDPDGAPDPGAVTTQRGRRRRITADHLLDLLTIGAVDEAIGQVQLGPAGQPQHRRGLLRLGPALVGRGVGAQFAPGQIHRPDPAALVGQQADGAAQADLRIIGVGRNAPAGRRPVVSSFRFMELLLAAGDRALRP